jgi:sulfur carrier protein
MNLTVNGVATETSDGITVTELLRERKVKMPDMVSVELNGEILERQSFATTALKAGDAVEFLYFMGGGRGAQ